MVSLLVKQGLHSKVLILLEHLIALGLNATQPIFYLNDEVAARFSLQTRTVPRGLFVKGGMNGIKTLACAKD
jgi:hypothetical protein